jgi:hypothetical protein
MSMSVLMGAVPDDRPTFLSPGHRAKRPISMIASNGPPTKAGRAARSDEWNFLLRNEPAARCVATTATSCRDLRLTGRCRFLPRRRSSRRYPLHPFPLTVSSAGCVYRKPCPDLLYAFVIVRLDRRELVWINVTTNPTAEWIARQITAAFPWDDAPQNTSVTGQRCAGLSPGSADWNHKFTPDIRRTSSSLRPRLGFRYTQEVTPRQAPYASVRSGRRVADRRAVMVGA